MSFLANSVNLDDLFISGSGGLPKGYKKNGQDLNTVYAPYISGIKANPTGLLTNGSDLCNHFQYKYPNGFVFGTTT